LNVTQHENGINILNSIKILFDNKGNVLRKSNSKNVYVYSIKGVKNIKNFVIPFYSKYIIEYSSKYKKKELDKFTFVVNKLIDNGFRINREKSCLSSEQKDYTQINQDFLENINTLNVKDVYKLKKNKLTKTEFIELVKIVYTLNPDGKGKKRKRTLSEVLEMIEVKTL